MNARVASFVLAALAATAPLWPRLAHDAPAHADAEFSPPPDLVPPHAAPIPLEARAARLARDFPGRIEVFATDDGRTWILRHVLRPTRKLHPATDCLRAVGYTITPRPLFIERDGTEWSESFAVRDGERLRVRERLVGADRRRWTDVSAWFWSATFGDASAPWWSVTELAPSP